MSRLLIATRSSGKLRELRPLFAARGIEAIDLAEAGIAETAEEDRLEVFETFEENAIAKAKWFFRLSGIATVADDSGIEVRALGGRPGVRSKRWSERPDLAGEALDAENNALLARLLEGRDDRAARYVCVAALCSEAGITVRRGEVSGHVLAAPRGRGGFGYDPYFYSTELGKTFGEATLEEKATVSHRARAFRALIDAIA